MVAMKSYESTRMLISVHIESTFLINKSIYHPPRQTQLEVSLHCTPSVCVSRFLNDVTTVQEMVVYGYRNYGLLRGNVDILFE